MIDNFAGMHKPFVEGKCFKNKTWHNTASLLNAYEKKR